MNAKEYCRKFGDCWKASAKVADHLDMSERNVSNVLNNIGMTLRGNTLDEIRVAYIRDLREKTARRGGDKQFDLVAAKTREIKASAQLKELQFDQRCENLVAVVDLEPMLAGWAQLTLSEITTALNKTLTRLAEEHGIDIDHGQVNDAFQFAFDAIGAYPKFLARTMSPTLPLRTGRNLPGFPIAPPRRDSQKKATLRTLWQIPMPGLVVGGIPVDHSGFNCVSLWCIV